MARARAAGRCSARAAAAVALLLLAARASTAVKVRVITNSSDPDFTYPELDADSDFFIDGLRQRPSLGIALGGGGWRAAALAYGWLRALHLMNVTSKAQYVSSVSGSAWAATPYAFTSAPLSRFFSPYFEPQNLTTSRLSMGLTPGSWGQFAAGKSLLLGSVGNPISLPGEPTNWANTVAGVFLAPFGLGSSDSSVSAAGTKGNLLRATRRRLLPMFPVHVACTDLRPYPITGAAIMTPEREVSPKFFPFEFTPLYVGMPPVADYTKPTALGGGFVEPLGFNTAAPRRRPLSKDGSESVDVALLKPTTTSSLVHVVGISSSAGALRMQPSNRLAANLFNGQMVNYWNLWDYKADEVTFVDGGAVDELGIMPLLRRGVKNVIACVPSRTDPDVPLKQFASDEYALAGLFGAVPLDARDSRGAELLLHGVDDASTWNEMQHVFPRDGFEDLFYALRTAHAGGDGHVIPKTYEVLPNSFMGVAGGYDVNVLWVINARSAQWEAALPEATRRWLDKQRDSSGGPYKGYPLIGSIMEAPGPLISLLSQQASWAFRSHKALVLDFVTASAGSASGPAEEVIETNSVR